MSEEEYIDVPMPMGYAQMPQVVGGMHPDYVKFITTEGNVKPKTRKRWWAYLSHHVPLGFMTDKEVAQVENRFRISKIRQQRGLLKEELTVEMQKEDDQVEFAVNNAARRARGFVGQNKSNERTMHVSQISQQFSSLQRPTSLGERNKSFFSSVAGMVRRK